MNALCHDALRPLRWFAGAVLILAAMVSTAAHAQEPWEMRVCASPYDPPMSGRDDGGFNNDIAEILADELGATVTYEWTRLDRVLLERTLLSGECDMVVGIAEGAGGVLSTVPYLRAPFVFVTRAEDDLDIDSFDDPRLEELTIGTYQQGLPSIVLDRRGIDENVEEYPPIATPGGPDRATGTLRALAAGEVDVAIVYAPKAAAFDARSEVDLRLEPVTPEIIPGPSLIQMSRTWTIGVRPGDEAFRDRLNVALAERWDDVRDAIAAYGVPQAELNPPTTGVATTERTSVGVLVPGETGGQVAQKAIGEPALQGAELAENVFGQTERGAEQSRVLYANAPTDAAAYRAARRLIATENVGALVGGFGSDQAERLGEIAREGDVVFFNVAATGTQLRRTCNPATFHVEASAAMLADATIDWYAGQGVEDWYVVHEDSGDGEALMEHLGASATNVVGSAATEPEQFVYAPVATEAAESGADAVLLALAPKDAELFLSQYPTTDGAPPVALVPRSPAQTREYLERTRRIGDVGAGVRAATWDAALEGDEAAELNEAYLSRTATPMDPTAWTTYAAVSIFHRAMLDSDARGLEALRAYLTAPERSFEAGKGVALSFRPWSQQLRQPLYLVRPDPEVSWSREPRVRADLAEIVAQRPVPGDEAADLDRYGVPADSGECGQ